MIFIRPSLHSQHITALSAKYMSKTPGDMVSSTTSSPSHHNTHTGMCNKAVGCCSAACLKQHCYQLPLYIRCMCCSMRGLVNFISEWDQCGQAVALVDWGWVSHDGCHTLHTCTHCMQLHITFRWRQPWSALVPLQFTTRMQHAELLPAIGNVVTQQNDIKFSYLKIAVGRLPRSIATGRLLTSLMQFVY